MSLLRVIIFSLYAIKPSKVCLANNNRDIYCAFSVLAGNLEKRRHCFEVVIIIKHLRNLVSVSYCVLAWSSDSPNTAIKFGNRIW